MQDIDIENLLRGYQRGCDLTAGLIRSAEKDGGRIPGDVEVCNYLKMRLAEKVEKIDTLQAIIQIKQRIAKIEREREMAPVSRSWLGDWFGCRSQRPRRGYGLRLAR